MNSTRQARRSASDAAARGSGRRPRRRWSPGKDAFEPSLPLSVVVHIDYRKAPLVIQRFGDLKRLVEQTLDPMVSVQSNQGKADYARAQQQALQIQTLAQAEAEKTRILAEGEAKKIRLLSESEADRAARVGIAQALAIEEQVGAYGGPQFQLTQASPYAGELPEPRGNFPVRRGASPDAGKRPTFNQVDNFRRSAHGR